MSRRINVDPLALTSGGTVVVNVAHFDVARRPERLLALATSLRGRLLFLGVELSAAEARDAVERFRAGHAEAVAYIVGKRRKRSQRRRGGTTEAASKVQGGVESCAMP